MTNTRDDKAVERSSEKTALLKMIEGEFIRCTFDTGYGIMGRNIAEVKVLDLRTIYNFLKDESSSPHVFLDCDGVLADFDAHGLEYFGMPPREAEKQLGAKEFWGRLEAHGDFYRSMPLMADAIALYEGVKHLSPTILTGCPKGNWAQGQKVAWAAEHFPGVPIITCRSADKRDYAKPGDVLIDDWPQHRHRWIEMGGHFIVHHYAESSLAALWAHYPHLKPLEQPS